MNNVPKFRGCIIFQTRVIRQRASLKIIVFSMETGNASGNNWSLLWLFLKTFLFSVKLKNIRIGTFLTILDTQNSKK